MCLFTLSSQEENWPSATLTSVPRRPLYCIKFVGSKVINISFLHVLRVFYCIILSTITIQIEVSSVAVVFAAFSASFSAVETSSIPALEFQRSCRVCVRVCLVSLFVCLSPYVCQCMCVCLRVCMCVRACVATAVRSRLMVIAVSRLAFWVESARVGVERVCGSGRQQQRQQQQYRCSSILLDTPRTAPRGASSSRSDLSFSFYARQTRRGTQTYVD